MEKIKYVKIFSVTKGSKQQSIAATSKKDALQSFEFRSSLGNAKAEKIALATISGDISDFQITRIDGYVYPYISISENVQKQFSF